MLVIFVPDGLDLGTAICAPWKYETLITLENALWLLLLEKKKKRFRKHLKSYLIFRWHLLKN